MNHTANTSERSEAESMSGAFLSPFSRHKQRFGPVRTARLKKLFAGYFVLYAASLLTLVFSSSQVAQAISLGVIFPGAGHLFLGHVITALVVPLLCVPLILFHPALLILFWVAVTILGGVHADADHAHSWSWVAYLVPLISLFGLGYIVRKSNNAYAHALKRRAETSAVIDSRPKTAITSNTDAALTPLNDRDLLELRFILDRALQPIENFDGFDWKDQLSLAAMRYQLSFSQLALSMYQYSRAPAFRGYVNEAQRNLILKMLDKRVWKYWIFESTVCNLEYNPDPIRRDNIMFSGYLGTMMGLYESTTGDTYFRNPGSISLQWSTDKVFNYDSASLGQVLTRQFDNYSYCLFPCEPSMIYPVCNGFGMSSVLMENRLGKQQSPAEGAATLQRYQKSLENEFVTVDGLFESMIMPAWGIQLWNTEANCATVGFLNHPCAPDVAERNWELMRHMGMEKSSTGKFEFYGSPLDLGTMKGTRSGSLTALAMAAGEMGDTEVFESVTTELESLHPLVEGNHGQRMRGLSNWARLSWAVGRFVRPGGFHDAVIHGTAKEILEGPILSEVPYPGVLVAHAENTAGILDFTLVPGDGPGDFSIKFAQLEPNCAYHLKSDGLEESIHTDSDGNASCTIALEQRKQFSLTR